MKKLLMGLLGLALLIIVGAVAAPFFIPVEVYKTQITAAAREATGRDLVIEGDVSLSIFPRLELQAGDVTFSNVAGGRAPQMASLKELIVQLQLLPLLSGEVRVDSFVLVDPVIALEVDPDGRGNWLFNVGVPEEQSEEGTEGTATGSPEIAEISLGDVRIQNGKLSFRDARTAQVIELSNINLSVSVPSLDAPFNLDGSLVWNQKNVALSVAGDSARALMEGRQAALQVALDVDVVSLEFGGTATLEEPLVVAGKVNLEVPSIRKLAAWAGSPLDAPGDGLGPLSIAGNLDLKGSQVSFSNAKIGLDGMTAEGDFTVDTRGKVPTLKGRLDWDQLDLNLYAASSPNTDEGTPEGAESDEVNVASDDWSDDEIDFSGLKSVNADFDLSVREILIDQMKIGKSVVKVGLRDGRLTVNLAELALYGGNGTANIVINGRAKVPLIRNSLSVTGVQLEPLLTDAADFTKMNGTGTIKFELSTHGRTERQLVAGLNGSGNIAVEDGAIRGANLGEMIRNSAAAFLGKANRQEAKTEFAEMSGSFTITNGILANKDLYMVGPYIKVTGAGTADINRRTLNYRVVPKAMASTGGADTAGVTVPVKIDGSWSDPRFRPDLAALVEETLKSPEKVIEGAKKTLKSIKKEGLRGLLDSLVPTAPPPTGDGEQSAPQPSLKDPRQLLKGLFGG